MKSLSANEAKQSLGRVLDTAQREPVLIRKHNRPAAVILSVAEYGRLRGLNAEEFTSFCDAIGERAEKRGLTESLLSDLLDES